MNNPYAVYVNCDGAMNYDSTNTGGIGFLITFPDTILIDTIPIAIGRYVGGNIEIYELESLIQAMKKTLEVFEVNHEKLKNVKQIIFITDRYGLREEDKTSACRIKEWRRNKWKNYEGKPIKNHKLLDELDKTRKKLCEKTFTRVSIEYRPRKQNKDADKLSKLAKTVGLVNESLAKKGHKVGTRKFRGDEIKYTKLKKNDSLHINVFRKDPVQDQWEIWVEICGKDNNGNKLKIYTDNLLASKLQRGNEYIVRIKKVFSHHIWIYKLLKKQSNSQINS